MSRPPSCFEAVVLGSSAGGLAAMSEILSGLDHGFQLPLIWVQHVPAGLGVNLARIMTLPDGIETIEAEDKLRALPARLHVAPPDYHLLLEADLTLSLSIDEPRRWSRPSIDVLFESAAFSCGPRVMAVILTGANSDGAAGLAQIKLRGGTTIAQDPQTAEIAMMPKAAIATGAVDYIVPLKGIAGLLKSLAAGEEARPGLRARASESEAKSSGSMESGGNRGSMQSPAR